MPAPSTAFHALDRRGGYDILDTVEDFILHRDVLDADINQTITTTPGTFGADGTYPEWGPQTYRDMPKTANQPNIPQAVARQSYGSNKIYMKGPRRLLDFRFWTTGGETDINGTTAAWVLYGFPAGGAAREMAVVTVKHGNASMSPNSVDVHPVTEETTASTDWYEASFYTVTWSLGTNIILPLGNTDDDYPSIIRVDAGGWCVGFYWEPTSNHANHDRHVVGVMGVD